MDVHFDVNRNNCLTNFVSDSVPTTPRFGDHVGVMTSRVGDGDAMEKLEELIAKQQTTPEVMCNSRVLAGQRSDDRWNMSSDLCGVEAVEGINLTRGSISVNVDDADVGHGIKCDVRSAGCVPNLEKIISSVDNPASGLDELSCGSQPRADGLDVCTRFSMAASSVDVVNVVTPGQVDSDRITSIMDGPTDRSLETTTCALQPQCDITSSASIPAPAPSPPALSSQQPPSTSSTSAHVDNIVTDDDDTAQLRCFQCGWSTPNDHVSYVSHLFRSHRLMTCSLCQQDNDVSSGGGGGLDGKKKPLDHMVAEKSGMVNGVVLLITHI